MHVYPQASSLKGNGLVLPKQKKLYKIPQYYGRILMNPNLVTDQAEKIE